MSGAQFGGLSVLVEVSDVLYASHTVAIASHSNRQATTARFTARHRCLWTL